MRQFLMTVMALAPFAAMVATAQAENQTPSPPTASHPVKKRAQTARPPQAVSAAQQAMEECKARYGGRFGRTYERGQFALIEACFKEKTGLYPGQANVNCNRRVLYENSYC